MRALRTLALVAFLLGSLADVSAATTLTTFSMNASAVGTDPQGMTVSETKTSVPGVTGFSDSAIAGAASADLFADVDVAGDAITVLVNAAANRAAAQSIRARAEAVIEFTLTQRATYALEALVEASGGASAGSSVDVATVFHAEQLGSPGQRVFSRRGSLAAGSYRIEVTCFAEGPTGVEKSARCGIALQIPAQTGPGIRWKRPGSGSFATGANWDPAQVPGAGDAAIFDLPRAYTVTVGDQSTTTRPGRLRTVRDPADALTASKALRRPRLAGCARGVMALHSRGPARSRRRPPSPGPQEPAVRKTLRDVMTARPVVVETTSSCLDAARKMAAADIGDVLVTENGGRVVGILTDRDIVVRAVAKGRDPARTRVGDVCSRNIVALGPDHDLDAAMHLMRDRSVKRIPILDGGRAIGVVSLGDIAQALDPDSVLGTLSSAPPNN